MFPFSRVKDLDPVEILRLGEFMYAGYFRFVCEFKCAEVMRAMIFLFFPTKYIDELQFRIHLRPLLLLHLR